ncbi:AAA family ATPase [Flavobacterium sp. J372]|uniref:AAA family ATPase n=1 Tax=Flavobacterium sp. J372 TaxID=2898436 RepID=UPI0035B51F62
MKPIDIIGLKNFRIFDFTTGFLGELSSINILTGANNSGKSSIIKALQMLKNSSKQNQFPLQLDLNQQEHF